MRFIKIIRKYNSLYILSCSDKHKFCYSCIKKCIREYGIECVYCK